jgi:peptide/nickel transport system permease protein
MNSKIKIWHLLFLIFALLAIIRYEYLFDLAGLYMEFLKLFLRQEQDIVGQLDFKFVDNFVSLVLIILIPIVLISVEKIRKFIYTALNLSSAVIILLVACFVFAPIISKQNPNFQKNISVTKLLPPFSSVKYIRLKNTAPDEKNNIGKFFELKKSVIPESFNDEIIFIDSIKSIQNLVENPSAKKAFPSFEYFQNGVPQKILTESLVQANGIPLIRKKYFIFGSDQYGRDIFTRIVYGSRISLLVGFGSVLLSLLIGVGFAFIAAQKGKAIDLMLSRLTDLFLSFPTIFLVIIILALFGSNIISVIVVLGLSGWMSLFKVVKTEMASIKKKDYYISSELIGLRNTKLLLREVLPVIIAPVIINLIFQFGNVILAESALSYLGLGTGTSYPSWGAMIEAGQEYITKSWWMIFIPGFILIITLLSINSVGTRINKFYNPKLLI